ncbi:MAG: GerW family sporulation protein [Oscillospiraceae bacterium]|nr:GerW family sporulation protein [Oscillospiraceae bacterium]MBQ8670828.1 GerW family sporulation protein [Oscillospiraceae bacterium]MBQ8917422.1 GerW family sporulation protein [Oscillospiraceae bacterium]MBQ9109169.1 GerW family sporulation protein [Oscillospiraceae bacterium]
MGKENINSLNDNVLNNLKGMVNADTIIGDPIHSEDGTTIIPVSKVSFAFASGGADTGKAAQTDKFGGGAGGGVTVTPIAFLVLKEGRVQLLQLADKGQTVDRLLNLVPETMDRISSLISKDKKPAEPAAKPEEEPTL